MDKATRQTLLIAALTYIAATSLLFVVLAGLGLIPHSGINGLPGRDGKDGADGQLRVYLVEKDKTLSYANGFHEEVYCDTGDVAIGGGYWSLTNLHMHISGPATGTNGGIEPIGWRVGVRRTEIDQISSDVQIYTICHDRMPLRP